jgi:type IV pilus assembly protein PilM
MKLDFFQKKIPAFGLDISSNSIKMVQLASSSSRIAIKGYTDVHLPKGVVQDDAIINTDTLASLIKHSLEKPAFGHIDTRHVVASLPESKSFVRVIQIPQMSDAEIENAILFEAENYIPIPIDQVYMDWQEVGKRGDKIQVLIIASPKDYVDKYIDVLEKADLKPVALEVESQSLVRSIINAGSAETTLIVDLDAHRSNLIMVEAGVLQFTSSIPIAGNTFTETIARALGVSSVKAEAVKKEVGIANTAEYPNIKTTLLPVLNNLSAEIKNILNFHEEHSQNKVSGILLCGGSAKLAHLDEFLRPEFASLPNFNVALADPWINLKNLDSSSLPSFEALSFATSIGLASRNL